MTRIENTTKNLVSSMYADDRLIMAKHFMDKINRAKYLKRHLGSGSHDKGDGISELNQDEIGDLIDDLDSVIKKANERLSALV